MSPRFRFRLVIVLLVLGPLAACALVLGWFLWSGRLERNIEAAYARRLPGQLQVGRVELSGPGTVVIHDLRLGDGVGTPLLTAEKVTARIRLLAERLDEAHLEGVRLNLDARNWDLLEAIIEKEHAIPSTRAPERQRFRIEGGVRFATGLALEDLRVDLATLGPELEEGGSATGRLGGRPFSIAIGTTRRDTGEMKYRFHLQEMVAELGPVLDACEDTGLIGRSPPWLRDYLPKVIDAGGTVVLRDANVYQWLVEGRAVWPPGAPRADASFSLVADRNRIVADPLRWNDPAVLVTDARGTRLVYDLNRDHLQLQAERWRPGPRLPIPDQVPTEALLALLPTLQLAVDCRRDREAVELVCAGIEAQSQARVVLSWSHDNDHLRLGGRELPLGLAQSFLPEGLAATGGQAEDVRITIADGRMRDFYLKSRQARFGLGAWSFGPGDGSFVLVPGPEDTVSLKADLGMGTLSWSGGATRAAVALDLRQVEGFLSRLRGPVQLPDLRGAVQAEAEVAIDGPRAQGRVTRLRLQDLTKPDLLAGVETRLTGDFSWSGDRLVVKGGGQLQRGRLRLPNDWVDMAARTPRFAIDAAFVPAHGYAPAGIEVGSILVRAADQRGEPLPDGFSAELAGDLTALGTGSIRGVLDHADLGWLAGLAPQPDAVLAGKAAISFEADLLRSQVRRVEGFFLPMDAFLRLGRSLEATNITGAVRFVLLAGEEVRTP